MSRGKVSLNAVYEAHLKELEAMPVVELRAELKALGLPVSGRKIELVERVIQSRQNVKEKSSNSSSAEKESSSSATPSANPVCGDHQTNAGRQVKTDTKRGQGIKNKGKRAITLISIIASLTLCFQTYQGGMFIGSLLTVECSREYISLVERKLWGPKVWHVVMCLAIFLSSSKENLGTVNLVTLTCCGLEVLLTLASVVFCGTPVLGEETSSTSNLPSVADAFPRLCMRVFGLVYVGWLFGIAGLLFHYSLLWLLFPIVVTGIGENGALLLGAKFGKLKIFPTLSPKKTLVGCLGQIVSSIAVAYCFPWMVSFAGGTFEKVSKFHLMVLGFLLGVAGILGDLFESLLKRSFGVKDMANFMPGVGGFMDRTDGQSLCSVFRFMDRTDGQMFNFAVVWWYLQQQLQLESEACRVGMP
eukprot:CAMPEP_0175177346 /NCGR_PEP_ID=MMETSP0087-20121206/34335_1 /TAXON_ID=136419 /ORGANISM="Unknown Unknown, Strain D1" /LENGTH=415 /DNA_ID=CAMNT_0016469313 /DNA_START=31 /DNA_END=1278 /DNA_ORIENTATION=+